MMHSSPPPSGQFQECESAHCNSHGGNDQIQSVHHDDHEHMDDESEDVFSGIRMHMSSASIDISNKKLEPLQLDHALLFPGPSAKDSRFYNGPMTPPLSTASSSSSYSSMSSSFSSSSPSDYCPSNAPSSPFSTDPLLTPDLHKAESSALFSDWEGLQTRIGLPDPTTEHEEMADASEFHEQLHGVKEGCQTEVRKELLASGFNMSRSGSPALTPGTRKEMKK